MSHAVAKCVLCSGEEQKPLFAARDRHYGIPGVFTIVRCEGCSLVFLNPMYSDTELAGLYPSDYYAYQDNFKVAAWKRLLKNALCGRVGTRDPYFSKPGRMLDLGCGSGWFLASKRDLGWETFGVEISESAAQLGQAIAGLNIYAGTLADARFPSNYFDYVRSNHSFEHMTQPRETLDEIRRVLKHGGKVLIGVPNFESLNAKIFGQYWWYLGAPVHPFTYSAKTLVQLLERHGFRVERVNYNSDWGGILGSVQIWLNRSNGRKSMEGWFINNRPLRVVCYWVAKVLDALRLGDAIEVIATKADA